VTLARNADLEQRNAGHEAQVGEMEEQVARERAVLHVADYELWRRLQVR
jgi:hypothetical protein